MRFIPSWIKFLAVTIAFELIVGSSEVTRLVGVVVPKTWWSLVGTRLATIAFMAVFAKQTLKSDGLRLGEVCLPIRDWKRQIPGAVLCGAFLGLGLMGLKATIAWWGIVGPINSALADVIKELEQSPSLGVALVATYALLAPLTEEFQFRAYAVESMAKAWGESPLRLRSYVAIGALVFMFSHPVEYPIYYPGYFLAGLFLGEVYIRTRSLAACVLAHGTANLVQLSVGLWVAQH